MPRLLIRMDDRPDKPKAAIVCTVAEAKRYNDDGHCQGVFATVNSFFRPTRRKEFVDRICAWAVDIDAGDKADQRRRILGSPLVPSIVVETRSGYHVYFLSRDGRPEHWNAIVLERLVPYFGADKNARDLCRILRVPGYWHFKDPSNPFLIRTAWEHHVVYSERQMGEAFRWVPDPKAHVEARAEVKRETSVDHGEDFWAAIGAIDCRDALERLSGSAWVNGETYSFRRTGRGNWNILVDGKGTSCFIDENGKLGSLSGGGPTPFQWLKWLGRTSREAVDAIMSIYPHIREIDERNKARERAEWIAQRRRVA
ncbi:MAG: hypothetical protein F9K40_09265 [Kofleriaceae bacterium]|nr:MAG: hypothetical protein F9K40_09265 [Kofleriaceae bacterium]